MWAHNLGSHSYIALQNNTSAHFKKTQHTTTTTWSKSSQEYNMNEKHNKKINHNLKTIFEFAKIGFNVTLPLCITKPCFGWKHNKIERVFINTTPAPWQSSPKTQCIVNLYIDLCFPCFINPKQKTKKH